MPWKALVTLMVLPLLMSCQPDVGVSTIRGEMIVSPSLSDVGLVGVGETLEFNLQLDHIDGPAVDIRNATLQWVEGGGFEVAEFPDTLDAFGTAFIAMKASEFQLGSSSPNVLTRSLGPAYSVTKARPSACPIS